MVVSNRLGPHHCGRSSGSLTPLNTSSRGASKTRVITTSWTPGSMMNSVAVMLAILRFLLLQFAQVVIDAIEALFPLVAVALDPVGDVLQPLGVQLARAPLRLPPLRHQPSPLQHLQVLRHSRKTQLEWLSQFHDRRLTDAQPLQDRAPGGIG